MPDDVTTPEDVTTETETPEEFDVDAALMEAAGGLFPEDNEPEPEPSGADEPALEPAPKTAETTHKVKIDGEEREVTYDELVRGYQTAQHNTRKGQQLADQERHLAALEGLATRLQTDPVGFAQAVLARHAPATQQAPKADETPPDDPVERLKWEIRKEVREELGQVRKQIGEETDHRAAATEILRTTAELRQDPQYPDVMQALHRFAEVVDGAPGGPVYQRLDTDPAYFRRMFSQIKAKLSGPAPAAGQDQQAPVKRETKPPVTMDPGNDVSDAALSRQAQRKKLKAKALRDGDEDAIMAYFQAPGGLVDDLGF